MQELKTIIVGRKSDRLSYGMIEGGDENHAPFVMQHNFYFGLVLGGSASVVGRKQDYAVSRGDLFVLTPTMSVSLMPTGENCRIECICLSPEFFDTLHDGQLTYNQLMAFFSKISLPIVRVDVNGYDYLKKTFSLFSGLLDTFVLNREGIVRHLCSFYLLQVANILYKEGNNETACVVRSNEILRRFKKLVMEHYRARHNLSFYADELHITVTYLSRTVKAVTGRTAHSMISDLLYADAVKYLKSTDMDVKEIAEMLGFSDQSSFGKFFLKRAKVSPLKYRLRQ